MKNASKKLTLNFKGEDAVIVYEGLKLLAAREGMHIEDYCIGVLTIFGDQTLKYLEDQIKDEEKKDEV